MWLLLPAMDPSGIFITVGPVVGPVGRGTGPVLIGVPFPLSVPRVEVVFAVPARSRVRLVAKIAKPFVPLTFTLPVVPTRLLVPTLARPVNLQTPTPTN